MPLYEYECQKCQHQFEALVFGDEAIECPECQATHLEKQVSIPAQTRTDAPSLPMNCPPGPPCGPSCCRL
jgi:putative FmdB family regulatory protein